MINRRFNKFVGFYYAVVVAIVFNVCAFSVFAELMNQPDDVAVLSGLFSSGVVFIINYFIYLWIRKIFKSKQK